MCLWNPVWRYLAVVCPLVWVMACSSPEGPRKEPVTPVAAPVAKAPPLQQPLGRVRGIDVSHYQSKVEWEIVKDSVSFVFIKATDSSRGVDPRFAEHWSGAKKVGLPRGAYHFFHPRHDVAEQVANFTKQLKADPGELPPVVDVEEFQHEFDAFTCEQLGQMLLRFSEGVKKELGRKPMIYTNHQTWQKRFCDHPYFVDHWLWLATYTHHAEPQVPSGWARWQFWQYTDKGTVEGISGQVDQSYFNGTAEELGRLR